MQVKEEKTLADRLKRELAIQTKVTTDGVSGELHAFNILKGINLANNVTLIGNAITAETSWHEFQFLGEEKNEIWQSKLEPVKHIIREIGADLKVDLAPLMTGMGAWGLTTVGEEIEYPLEDSDWITLWNAIYTKYGTYGAGLAPIEMLLTTKGYVMATINTSMTVGEAAHDAAITAYNNAYIQKEAMEEDMIEPNRCDTLIIEKLKVLHSTDMRSFGKYGIKTTNAKTAKHQQDSTINPVTGKAFKHLVNPSILKSNVNWELHVFIGDNMDGDYIILPANGEINMGDGCSAIIIYNPHATLVAKVTMTVWQLKRH